MKKKLTLIKVSSFDETLSTDELIKNQLNKESSKEIIEYDDNNSLILVKIGDNHSKPTFDELEEWRRVFEQYVNDKEFMIISNNSIDIEVINFDQNGQVVVLKD